MPQTEGDQARIPILLTREQWDLVIDALDDDVREQHNWADFTELPSEEQQAEALEAALDAIADQLREVSGE